MATRAMIKSKYPPMRPTQAIGSPLPQPNVDIPEPATLTGDWTGKPYVNVGDSPYGREGFQVTPPGGRPPASMANGGSAVVGPTDTPPPPFDPFTDPRWTGNAPMRPGAVAPNGFHPDAGRFSNYVSGFDPVWTNPSRGAEQAQPLPASEPPFDAFTDPGGWPSRPSWRESADDYLGWKAPASDNAPYNTFRSDSRFGDVASGFEPAGPRPARESMSDWAAPESNSGMSDADFAALVQRLHNGSRAQIPGKPVSMGFGGGGSVGPDTGDYDPNTMLSNNPNVQYSTPDPQQPPPQQPQQAPSPAPAAPYDPVRTQYNAQNTVYQNQNAGVDARVAQTNAQGNVYSATAGTFGPMQNQINANGQVIDAQGRVTGASRALIQSQQGDNSARTAEENQLQADARNTPDLQAAAQAQTYRNDMAYKNSAAGVSAAQEYVAPPGDTSQAPAGTLAKIQSKGQVDATAFANADKLRALQLEAQKSGVDLLSNDVQGLQEVAAKVGLSVDQARLLVSEASNKADFAGLAVQNADNNTSRAVIQLNQSKNIDPSKDIYRDPLTGNSSLMSPNDARLAKANDDRRFAQTDPGGGSVLYNDPYTGVRTYMTQAEADQKKIDYQQQLDAANLQGNANLGAARGNAQNAAQSAQEIQYAQNPNLPSTPVSWLLQNMTGDRLGPSGTLYHSQGLLSRDQVIAALIAHGFTPQQAQDMTAPNTATKGGSGANKPAE